MAAQNPASRAPEFPATGARNERSPACRGLFRFGRPIDVRGVVCALGSGRGGRTDRSSLAGFHATSGDAGFDGAAAAFGSATAVIIGLVRVELVRPLLGATPPRAPAGHGVEGWSQHDAVVAVGRAQAHPERRAPAVDHKVALRARFAAIRWVRAGLGAPLFAATAALSSAARLQSSCPASESRSSSTRCSPVQTPASCQSRNLRQQVMPEQPSSRGSISQGMPERRTKTIPAKAARSSQRGRPPLGLGGSEGSSGSMAAQRSSETRGLFIPPQRSSRSFVRCSYSMPNNMEGAPRRRPHLLLKRRRQPTAPVSSCRRLLADVDPARRSAETIALAAPPVRHPPPAPHQDRRPRRRDEEPDHTAPAERMSGRADHASSARTAAAHDADLTARTD
jgi:hypothetical protein